jgi:hypothetical protein
MHDIIADLEALKSLQERAKLEIAALRAGPDLETFRSTTKPQIHMEQGDETTALTLRASTSGRSEQSLYDVERQEDVQGLATTGLQGTLGGRRAATRGAPPIGAATDESLDYMHGLGMDEHGDVKQACANQSQHNQLQDVTGQSQPPIISQGLSNQSGHLQRHHPELPKSSAALASTPVQLEV